MYDIIVIGGGAAGMMAAITAAKEKTSVLLLEHMEECGKKILVTGNGRCNYTNMMQGIEYYRGDDPAFVLPGLDAFGYQDTMQFFKELGVLSKEKKGYVYPRNMQASTIRDALLSAMHHLGVQIICNCGIREIRHTDSGYEICTKNGDFLSETVILATGGKSNKKTGSDGSGFLYLDKLSHNTTDLVPALVGLKATQSFCKKLAGIRAEARVNLFVDNSQISADTGELQMTDYGISGIPTFQISRYAAKALHKNKEVHVLIDFLPELSQEEIQKILDDRKKQSPNSNLQEVWQGLVNRKLCEVVLSDVMGVCTERKLCACSRQELVDMVQIFKGLRMDIYSTGSYEQAQVTAGGVCTTEIHAQTMESALHDGLFFAGEMIDVDGMCGGYNLQWAWSSGYLAGKHAAIRAKGLK